MQRVGYTMPHNRVLCPVIQANRQCVDIYMYIGPNYLPMRTVHLFFTELTKVKLKTKRNILELLDLRATLCIGFDTEVRELLLFVYLFLKYFLIHVVSRVVKSP